MKKTIIKTKEIVKTFVSDSVSLNAVNNVSIDIYEGDFTVIMGSSGSGKSTLLYMLSGLDNLTSGQIAFEDNRIDLMKETQTALFRRHSIGFVFQAINLIPNLTLLENITVAGFLISKDKNSVILRANELLDRMNLSNEKNRLPSQVSGGQQQRAAIARALINNPKVLFADEPTGGLNSQQSINVLDVMSDVNAKDNQTIVMVTHDVKAAVRADRLLFIKDGQIDGDLTIDKYSKEKASDREQTIIDYLSNKGW